MLLVNKARRPNRPTPPRIGLTPAEQEVQNIVQTAIEDLQPAAGSQIVRQGLEARNIQQVVDSFPWEETTETLGLTEEIFQSTILENLGKIQPVPTKIFTGMRFDITDPRATEWARTQSARLVTAVTDETRNIIREVVADAFTKNITVYDTAKRLRSVIGLNNRQFESYMRFTESLGNSLREQGLTGRAFQDAFDRMSKRQYDRMIKYRSELIARTEIIMAENNGQYLGWQQAVEQGYADPKSMKRWSTSTDERTCNICMPMNGMSVQWDQPYPNGVFQPPAHPMCRCSISLLEPDSSLAQNFMTADTPPVETLENIMPEIETLAPTLPSLVTIDDAVATANETGRTRQSAFQYDAGDIENLNVTVQPVKFNGTDHTELRFKLTPDAKKTLVDEIKREGEKSGWEVVKGVSVVDKKTGLGSSIKFSKPPEMEDAFDRTYYIRRGTDDEFAAIGLSKSTTKGTYTRYYPDGTAIRFISDDEDLFAFDGMARVMIPGKATPRQVQEAMSKLGITANRVPTAEDVERLKVNRILALLKPEYKTSSKLNSLKDIQQRRVMAQSLLRNYGVTLDDVSIQIDDLGNMKFILPDAMVEKIVENSKVGGFRHSMNTANLMSPQAYVDLIMDGHLYSSTSRFNRGTNILGMSTSKDLATGGGDYVFLSPFRKGDWGDTRARTSATIYFKPKSVLRRTDWFAWRSDKYGVINPNEAPNYFENADALDVANWIKELESSEGGGELMVQHALSFDDAEFIYVPDAWRDEILTLLRVRGKRTLGGRPIEEVIVGAS